MSVARLGTSPRRAAAPNDRIPDADDLRADAIDARTTSPWPPRHTDRRISFVDSRCRRRVASRFASVSGATVTSPPDSSPTNWRSISRPAGWLSQTRAHSGERRPAGCQAAGAQGLQGRRLAVSGRLHRAGHDAASDLRSRIFDRRESATTCGSICAIAPIATCAACGFTTCRRAAAPRSASGSTTAPKSALSSRNVRDQRTVAPGVIDLRRLFVDLDAEAARAAR